MAVVRWLRQQTEQGLSASMAVAQLRQSPTSVDPPARASFPPEELSAVVVQAALAFDSAALERALSQALAAHPLELVCLEVVQPALVELGERWHRGEISPAVEHFATALVRRRLEQLSAILETGGGRPLVVLGAAPGEQHEIGALIMSLFLRRRGLRVIYLGADVSLDAVLEISSRLRPDLICLSASTPAGGGGAAPGGPDPGRTRPPGPPPGLRRAGLPERPRPGPGDRRDVPGGRLDRGRGRRGGARPRERAARAQRTGASLLPSRSPGQARRARSPRRRKAGRAMTYGAFLLLFLVLPILALAVALRRRMTRAWRWSVGAVALIAVLYTTPWDNFIVAQGVWSYPPDRVLGVTLGLVPLEEYVFFVLQVLLTGLVLLALTGRPVAPLPPAAGSDGTG